MTDARNFFNKLGIVGNVFILGSTSQQKVATNVSNIATTTNCSKCTTLNPSGSSQVNGTKLMPPPQQATTKLGGVAVTAAASHGKAMNNANIGSTATTKLGGMTTTATASHGKEMNNTNIGSTANAKADAKQISTTKPNVAETRGNVQLAKSLLLKFR